MVNMKKILVTGGSGLVGRHLKDILPEATYLSSKEFDLTAEADVKNLFSENWDHVVHLAARVGGILDNMKYPSDFIEQNVLMNTLVVKYARFAHVPRLTAVLSSCIFPDISERYPMTEEDLHLGPPQKTNFAYAIAKRTLAVQIDASNQQYLTNYNYLIPCNLYGEYDRFDEFRSHYLTALLGKIVKAEDEGAKCIKLLGTGKPLRQFMYAADLARVIHQTIHQDICASFIVATNENRSIREIAEIALEVTGHGDLELLFDTNAPDGQFRKDVANSKMMSLFPEFQFTALSDGIKRVYDHYTKAGIQ
jgi:GDP-L-fucose synthase